MPSSSTTIFGQTLCIRQGIEPLECSSERVTQFIKILASRLHALTQPHPYIWEVTRNGTQTKIGNSSEQAQILQWAEWTLIKLLTTKDALTPDEIWSIFRLLQDGFIHEEFVRLVRYLVWLKRQEVNYTVDGNEVPLTWFEDTSEIQGNIDFIIKNRVMAEDKMRNRIYKRIVSQPWVSEWVRSNPTLLDRGGESISSPVVSTPVGIFTKDGLLLSRERHATIDYSNSWMIELQGKKFYIVTVDDGPMAGPTFSYYNEFWVQVVPTLNGNKVEIFYWNDWKVMISKDHSPIGSLVLETGRVRKRMFWLDVLIWKVIF